MMKTFKMNSGYSLKASFKRQRGARRPWRAKANHNPRRDLGQSLRNHSSLTSYRAANKEVAGILRTP
jgi:hypothetical protein